MATLPVPDVSSVDRLISIDEYLRTSFEVECEFVDGHIEERNVGEHDHGYLQLLLGHIFMTNDKAWGVRPVTDVRMRVSRNRVRVPDLTVLRADAPRDPVTSHPPLIVIEILSPEDRLSRYKARISDFLAFGVEHIWIFDPERREAHVATATGLHLVQNDELTVPGTPIRLVLSEVFAKLA